MKDAEALNQISEILYGYREGSTEDIIKRVRELEEMRKGKELQEKHKDIFKKFHEMQRELEEIVDCL